MLNHTYLIIGGGMTADAVIGGIREGDTIEWELPEGPKRMLGFQPEATKQYELW
jgi:hypothetical protein